MMMMKQSLLILLVATWCWVVSDGSILFKSDNDDNDDMMMESSLTVSCCGGAIVRLHYLNDHVFPSSCDLIILGVGTAMSVHDYDKISYSILHQNAQQGIIVAILDAAPFIPVKLFAKPFAKAVNHLVQEVESLVPVCQNTTRILVGGHSASGAAAFSAFRRHLYDDDRILGFVGLDPFLIHRDKARPISVPSLYWGFSTTTCGASVSHAAQAAYDDSTIGRRLLWQVQNPDNSCSHCSFTDHGCTRLCPLTCPLVDELYHDAGVSVWLFLKALTAPKFSRSQFNRKRFQLNRTELVLVLDDDDIEEIKR